MRRHLFLVSGLVAIAGCALDPSGAAPTDGSTGATSGDAGPGPASGATSTGPGASTASGAGGDPQGSGGGATSTGTGEGAGSGEGGTGDGGAGGAGGVGGGGDGGAGGAGGFCGDGVVDLALAEECDEPANPLECDPNTCTWLGACGVTRDAPRVPGGFVTPGDTTVAPSTTEFGGACSDAAAAPVHLYEYTTGDLPSQVLAYVEAGDDQGLGDPILSIVTSCTDETTLTCVFQQGLFPCCVDQDPSVDEALVTTTLPPGTTITVAVSGAMGDSGAYALAINEYRYLLLETFESGVGSFATTGWSEVGPTPNCSGGDRCMYVPDPENGNAVLTSGPFDATDVGEATLGWWHRVDNSGSNSTDTQIVEVSTDGGQTWEMVYEQDDGVDEFGVEKRVADLGPFIAGEPDVRLRFVYSEGNGWFVDDVFVIGW